MKILITNDDGLKSTGLKILASIAKEYGEVICVAPILEQSAKSHALKLKEGILFKQVKDIINGVKTYIIDGTPSDCVQIAYYHLKYDFDIVLSGVNDGFNVGEDILYSGTVGAAEEALIVNKKGIAFSTSPSIITGLDKSLNEVFRYIFDNKLLDKSSLFNINIPYEYNSIKITKQGIKLTNTYFKKINDKYLYSFIKNDELKKIDIDTDVYAINNKIISITPLKIDRTNYDFFKN